MADLGGRVALITGGATGIGLATARRFSRAGAAVVINYSRSAAAAQAAVAELTAAGGRALAVRADVSHDGEVRAMMDRAVAELGGIDYLVNNAGWTRRVQPHRDFESLTDDVWDRVWAVNVKGVFYCVRAATPHLLRREGGAVVNVTSIAAYTGTGSSMAYAASKGALEVLTLSLARALAPIRVNAVAPGLIATGFGGWTAVHWEAIGKQTPIGRLPTDDETAQAIVFLATATGVTGQSILVDGGFHRLGPVSA